MKYFLDTEFLEGSQKTFFGKSKPTIDLISIGIVDENGNEYYAISKDFNLKEAWNRFDLVNDNSVGVRIGCSPLKKKIYWIRENVLKPIFEQLCFKEYMSLTNKEALKFIDVIKSCSNQLDFFKENFLYSMPVHYWEFNCTILKELINRNGKSNKDIAKEVEQFCKPNETKAINAGIDAIIGNLDPNTEFYGYYSDYDWVVFCWLFGKMMDLPKGFPMYCRDLKQMSDDVYNEKKKAYTLKGGNNFLLDLKKHPEYPKQYNEHNALSDAKWNLELFKFLQGVG